MTQGTWQIDQLWYTASILRFRNFYWKNPQKLILAGDIRSRSWPNIGDLYGTLNPDEPAANRTLLGCQSTVVIVDLIGFLMFFATHQSCSCSKRNIKNILENILFWNPKPGETWTRLEPEFMRSSPYYDWFFWPRIMKTQNFRLGSGFFGFFARSTCSK